MNLKKNEKELISKEIENLEKLSSSELVAVVAKRSGNYKLSASMFSVILLFCTSFLYYFFVEETSIIQLLEIQFVTFIGFYLLFGRFRNFLLFVLPKKYKHKIASQNAHKQFYNLKLNNTKNKQAIMFFVSLDEKFVEIITDEEISKEIPNSHWQMIIDEFIIDIKNNQLLEGYLKAIKACSYILNEKFPKKENDENELSNEVIKKKKKNYS